MVKEETYTCIFGGGAIRGLAYIGAIRAMNEIKLNCDTFVGSSVGSVIATLYSLKFSVEEIKSIFMGANFELFKDIRIGFNKDMGISKGDVFTQWIRDIIEEKFYGNSYKKGKNIPIKFSDLKENLIIYTTNLKTYKCKEFSKQETPDFEVAEALRISCSMPGLMPPTQLDDAILVDGDLLKSVPLWKLSKNLKVSENKILEFRLEGESNSDSGNPLDFVNDIYSCMTSVSTDYIINQYKDKDDFDYIKLNTGDVFIANFNISKEERNKLIQHGYEQTIEFLTEILPKKKKNLIKVYVNISQKLIKIFDSIKNDNIEKSNKLLGNFYIDYYDFQNVLADSFNKQIEIFKNELQLSSKGKTWFGKPRFKDKKKLLNNLSVLISDINNHISELQHTVNKIEILSPTT